jgi:transposase
LLPPTSIIFSSSFTGHLADNQAVASERPVELAAAAGAARMAQPTYQQLLDIIDRKDQRIAQLESQVEQLAAQVRQLTAQLQEALRAGKRQAAPFSKGPPKPDPKPPGRKAGKNYGKKAHRLVPDQPPDEVIDVPLPDSCPHCGGSTVEDRTAQQYQTEIPRRPFIRRFDLHIGHCRRCGKRIQPRHPLQTSDALGAAASQLGPDAQSAIAHLNKHAGLPHGKIADFFDAFFGIKLSRGGACQSMLRSAERAMPAYHAIVLAIRRFPWVVPDETGWRIGGHKAWLHTFVTESLTGYVIDLNRGGVAERIIGWRYAGVLIHDGFGCYGRFAFARHQTCLNHLLTRCKNLLQTATAGAVRFPSQIKSLLSHALAVRDRRDAGQLSPHGLACCLGRLKARLARLLFWHRANADNERLANHLYSNQNHLFTFLEQDGIDATNHRAERAIRPAVLARKISGGSRTERGALAHACLTSVIQSARQQGRDFCQMLADLLCGRHPRLNYLPAGP